MTRTHRNNKETTLFWEGNYNKPCESIWYDVLTEIFFGHVFDAIYLDFDGILMDNEIQWMVSIGVTIQID